MSEIAGRGHDWTDFALWALAGLATSFAIVAGFSIGILVVPVAVALILLAARHGGAPAPTGLLLGTGLTATVIGLINLDELSCPESGTRVRDEGRVIEGCGSFDPLPWLLIGAALVLGSALAEWLRRR